MPDAPRSPTGGSGSGAAGDGDPRPAHPLELEWYANWFDVGHNALQFKIDCARVVSRDGDESAMYIRVTSDALRARQLFQLLGAELLAFMDVHGPIVSERGREEAP